MASSPVTYEQLETVISLLRHILAALKASEPPHHGIGRSGA